MGGLLHIYVESRKLFAGGHGRLRDWGMGAFLCGGECFRQVSANTGTWRKGRVFAKVKGKGRVVRHIADPGGSKESLERINLHRAVVL